MFKFALPVRFPKKKKKKCSSSEYGHRIQRVLEFENQDIWLEASVWFTISQITFFTELFRKAHTFLVFFFIYFLFIFYFYWIIKGKNIRPFC